MVILAAVLLASPLFSASDPIAVRLEGPVAAIARKEVERPFVLLHDGRRFNIGVKVRGKSRRQFCKFPPLRLNFDNMAADSVFEGQSKLKLVTHCAGNTSDEANMLEEYVAYRILNLVTDVSFRTRLLRVNYVDVDSRRSFERWAFVIEDIDALAQRVGGKHIEPKVIARRDLDADHAARVALFQFLIGNTDYSVVAAPRGGPCCHNAKLVQTETTMFGVPYDFDISGLVNPSDPRVDTVQSPRSLRVRAYRGFCTDDATLDAAVDAFRPMQAQIESLIQMTPGMPARAARVATKYVAGFFALIEKSGSERFKASCR